MTRYDSIEPNMTQSNLKNLKTPVPVAVVIAPAAASAIRRTFSREPAPPAPSQEIPG